MPEHVDVRVGDIADAMQFYDAVFAAPGQDRFRFAAFLPDPEGNDVEAVRIREQE